MTSAVTNVALLELERCVVYCTNEPMTILIFDESPKDPLLELKAEVEFPARKEKLRKQDQRARQREHSRKPTCR